MPVVRRGLTRWVAVAAVFALSAATAMAGELRKETVFSPVLGRDVPIVVYTPDGYESGTDRYSVLYLLHGHGDTENSWADKGGIKEKADALIRSGAMPRALIVMPGCPGCWWIDGAKDKAETAFWNDLVPGIAKRYRTIERREGRLIGGLSAGGFATVRYSFRYPDRFAAAAALSPAIYHETPPLTSAARKTPQFMGQDGTFSQAAWDRLNYPSVIESYLAQSQKVPMFLVSGDGDTLGIAFETALLFKRLFDKQPEKLELRIVDGDHSWKVWNAVMTEALTYVFKFAAPPEKSTLTAKAAQQDATQADAKSRS
jgi:enterochelin esterase-like enzyme